MATNFVYEGERLELTAPTGGVTTGVGVLIGTRFVVALVTAVAGAKFNGAAEGVWDLAKVSAQAWGEGDKIYWDQANGRCTNVPTAGLRLIGVCVLAAANPSSTGRLDISEGNALLEDDSAPAPASHADVGPVTLTAAEVLGGIIVADTNGAGRTYTLPTAALLVAALPGVAVGDVVRCLIVNGADAAEVLTLAAGAGGGFDANQTASSRVIGQNTSKVIAIRFTNVTPASEAYVVYA